MYHSGIRIKPPLLIECFLCAGPDKTSHLCHPTEPMLLIISCQYGNGLKKTYTGVLSRKVHLTLRGEKEIFQSNW